MVVRVTVQGNVELTIMPSFLVLELRVSTTAIEIMIVFLKTLSKFRLLQYVHLIHILYGNQYKNLLC
jgi:hypothetical protein